MSVVKIARTKKDGVIQDCDVYIGRACQQGGWNLDRSVFANPFRVGKDGDLATVLDLYRDHILRSPAAMKQLPTLKGKRLGCWCHMYTPSSPEELQSHIPECHGDVLLQLIAKYVK